MMIKDLFCSDYDYDFDNYRSGYVLPLVEPSSIDDQNNENNTNRIDTTMVIQNSEQQRQQSSGKLLPPIGTASLSSTAKQQNPPIKEVGESNPSLNTGYSIVI